MIRGLFDWLGRQPHRHEWEDGYVFDSCILRGTDGSMRVLGQAVMMFCRTCPAMKRRPLKTWREARIARKLIAARDRADA